MVLLVLVARWLGPSHSRLEFLLQEAFWIAGPSRFLDALALSLAAGVR